MDLAEMKEMDPNGKGDQLCWTARCFAAAKMEQNRMEAGRDRTAGGSARKGKDRYASIRVSLEQHAERVAKKQRMSEGTSTGGKTAAQRLADIRARVLAKYATGAEEECGGGEEGRMQTATLDGLEVDRGRRMEQGRACGGSGEHRTWADGKPISDEGHAIDAAARRNELPKIHFSTGARDATLMSSGPACEARSGDTAGDRRCTTAAEGTHGQDACGGSPCTSSDTANAASLVAWHAVESGIKPR